MDANKKAMLRNIRQALVVTLVLLLLCGFVFPVLLSGLSGLLFPHQAGGSLVTANGKAVGAKLVGQEFTEAYFMKGRPSAYHYNTYYTDEQGSRFYNDGSEFAGLGSGSNNYAPSNPALTQRVEADIEAFLAENPGVAREDIPADLMTASGSGLDPHISPDAAYFQVPAVVAARTKEGWKIVTDADGNVTPLAPEAAAEYKPAEGETVSDFTEDYVKSVIKKYTEGRFLGIFGEKTVNVLLVNLTLDGIL